MMKVALIQLMVVPEKKVNISRAVEKIRFAVDNGAKIVILPECFNSPYGHTYFPTTAEEVPAGETSQALSAIAKELKIHVIGGTIPEKKGEKMFNTCTVWGPAGELLAVYRKMHLFDIDFPGKITFKESDSLTGGSELATVTIGDIKIGLGICYDIRFDELAKLYRKEGCNMLVYPGAFNLTTGPIHWELLGRARAMDSQCYVAVCSLARDVNFSYVAWGHSMFVNPWAKVTSQAGPFEEVIFGNIDLNEVKEVRGSIPLFDQRRTDLYDTILKK